MLDCNEVMSLKDKYSDCEALNTVSPACSHFSKSAKGDVWTYKVSPVFSRNTDKQRQEPKRLAPGAVTANDS